MSLVGEVISFYYPDWEEPHDYGADWISCLCPWHGDQNPSASVSPARGAYHCSACGKKGDVIGIVRAEEGLSYQEAIDRIVEISPGTDPEVLTSTSGKSGRGVSRTSRTASRERGRAVRTRVRGGPRTRT